MEKVKAQQAQCPAPPRRVIWPDSCARCGGPLTQCGRGRPRKYCQASCRQRAYEHRRTARAVAPVQERLDQATWRLGRLSADLATLLGVAEPSLALYPDAAERGLWQSIVDMADPHRFAQRHGRWRSRR
jgi:hypothetical protein